jgi:kinesin family protein 4/21/27
MGTTGEDDEEAGIIPRAINHIFNYLRSDKAAGRMASVRVSMIELYNDECKDLLHPEIPSRDIMIREDKHGRIFFTGAREEVVNNAVMAMQYLEQGNLNRSTAETMMNQNSSRSHAIFTISLEMLEYSVSFLFDFY